MIDLDVRQVALRLQAAGNEYESLRDTISSAGDGTYTINGKYTVDLNLAKCTCPDAEYRDVLTPCKHLIMIWLHKYAESKSEVTPF